MPIKKNPGVAISCARASTNYAIWADLSKPVDLDDGSSVDTPV
jgi:hypothetical protein